MKKILLDEAVDAIEQNINNLSSKLLDILLKDRTTNKNILWATNSYQNEGFYPETEIKKKMLIGENIKMISPRVSKNYIEQINRTRDKGEVFTPSWICNKQNNLIDKNWFGTSDVFNIEKEQSWITNRNKIIFSNTNNKTWKNYVKSIRLEIACGEAPYLVSRYDVVKGAIIPIEDRIGILDRKLRVICENINDEKEWLEWAKVAYKSTYGFDYQGDNVLIARENLLYTLNDYSLYKFNHQQTSTILKDFATIISWNIWQMDALTYKVPCLEKEITLFDYNDPYDNNYCVIKDWDNDLEIRFKDIANGVVFNE